MCLHSGVTMNDATIYLRICTYESNELIQLWIAEEENYISSEFNVVTKEIPDHETVRMYRKSNDFVS